MKPPAVTPPHAESERERERVVELLTRQFARDAITATELEGRLERVYLARTAAELDAIVADLPAPPAEAVTIERITALLSGQERRLTGVVPRDLRLRARLGNVELDLTQATFQPGVTTIDARAFMGYVQIRLPFGVRVESGGRALFGFFAISGPVSTGDPATVVRVTGRATLGFVECHAAPPGARSGV